MLFKWVAPFLFIGALHGEVYHPVSTSNPEVQKLFNKGLTYLFAFNHDIAFDSFKKASELDPNLAMAYWGMALARGQNVNEDITPENEIKCYRYVQEALKRLPCATPVEKAYIEALSTRYSDDPKADLIQLRFDYRKAMAKLIEAYPEDLDALTLYSESILDLDPWNWWTNEGKPEEGTLEAVEKLNFVLSRNPDHIGANHFNIHAWEESPTPQRALISAHRLESLLPESGHLLHMPCHIFIPVGDYESALKTNKNAIEQDKKYFRNPNHPAGTYTPHYLSHNMSILTRIYKLMEDYDNGIKAAYENANFSLQFLEKMPGLAHYTSAPLNIYLYFKKWNEILNYQSPSKISSEQAYLHYAKAKAHANLGHPEAARKEQELMNSYRKNIDPKDEIARNPATVVLELAALDLEATLEKDLSRRESLLRKAVSLQDTFYYDEPPSWYTHMRIPLGQALLEQEKFEQAQETFEELLKSSLQRNGRALFGLYHSLKGQHKDWEAFWIQREMAGALKHASKPLQLEDLK